MLSLKLNKSSHWNQNKCWPFLSIFSCCTHYHYYPAYLFAVFDRGGSWYKFSEIPRQPPAPAWNMTKYNTNIAYILGHTRQTIPILTFFVQLGASKHKQLWIYKLQRKATSVLKQRRICLPNGFDCLPPKSGAWLDVTQITESQTHSHAHTHNPHSKGCFSYCIDRVYWDIVII